VQVSAIQPVILAGGTGSRLWPLSRELYPKQLLQLTENTSLLQTTLLRILQLENSMPPLVVVGEEHRFIARNQMEELDKIGEYTIVLEPVGRNTAPAACAAAEYCSMKSDDDIVMLVLPADHLITRESQFRNAVNRAAELAGSGAIVTFGIQPLYPETGYGYIEKGEGSQVASFREKPDAATAAGYLESGNYFWNSGMFAFSVHHFKKEMEKHAPEMLECMRNSVKAGARDGCFFRLDPGEMERCPDNSIDYALLEKTDCAAVVAADLGWSDIGSWQALWDVSEKDESGNVCSGDVVGEENSNCLIRAGNKLVAAVGLHDTLVVDTDDAVLVAPLGRSQDVKKIVARLKKDQRKEYIYHRTVYRPWGSYTVLEEQDRYQMKRITVKPGARLSLQMHHHRHEHWVMVTGTARITNGDSTFLLHENQSTYIPAGVVHRLENPGTIALELIEVQIGSYLGEDDIVRYDDDFGREERKD